MVNKVDQSKGLCLAWHSSPIHIVSCLQDNLRERRVYNLYGSCIADGRTGRWLKRRRKGVESAGDIISL